MYPTIHPPLYSTMNIHCTPLSPMHTILTPPLHYQTNTNTAVYTFICSQPLSIPSIPPPQFPLSLLIHSLYPSFSIPLHALMSTQELKHNTRCVYTENQLIPPSLVTAPVSLPIARPGEAPPAPRPGEAPLAPAPRPGEAQPAPAPRPGETR